MSTIIEDAIGAYLGGKYQDGSGSIWRHWFLSSLYNHKRIFSEEYRFAHIYEDVKESLARQSGNLSSGNRRDYAFEIAKIIASQLTNIRAGRRRSYAKWEREELYAETGGRCWVCGYKFSDEAAAIFLNRATSTKLKLPLWIDKLRPRGLVERDIRIEVDHVHPFSLGGGEDENLKLSCGWCNTHKGNLLSIYERGVHPRSRYNGAAEEVLFPLPSWVVFLLSNVQICEFQGCECTAKSAELSVRMKNPIASPNPFNMMVVCNEHNEIGSKRWVPREKWSKVVRMEVKT